MARKGSRFGRQWRAGLCILAVLLGAGCRPAGESIDLVGSETMLNLAQMWAQAYHRHDPAARVTVVGGGSGAGIAGILNGHADITLASRPVGGAEWSLARRRGIDLVQRIVGWDGLAIIMNVAQPVPFITMAQAAAIFSGETTDWTAIGGVPGPITVLGREVNSGTHVYFRRAVLGNRDFAPGILKLPSNRLIHDTVAVTPGAVGYVSLADVSPAVWAAPLSAGAGRPAVRPSPEAVIRGMYPLRRPLYLYYVAGPNRAVAAMLELVEGPLGQQLLQAAGFIPVHPGGGGAGAGNRSGTNASGFGLDDGGDDGVFSTVRGAGSRLRTEYAAG